MISLIVAMDKNRGIGYKGNLLTYIPGDLPRFSKLTTGHNIIMGRKTFDSLPKGPLPNRNNIVITRNKNLNIEGVTVVNSLDDALTVADNGKEIFIIGGGEIYTESLLKADQLYITHIDKAYEADTFFPEFLDNWKVTKIEEHREDPNTPFAYINYVKA